MDTEQTLPIHRSNPVTRAATVPTIEPFALRLVDRWEDQARHRPDAEAIRADGHASLTYAQASATAHRWAQTWKDQGLRPGDRVLLRCAAGPTWVVTVWAAWLAGLVWTPCPPDVPAVRADAILHDLEPRLIVDAPSLLDAPVFEYRPASKVPTPPGTAYIIYTSGSTGTPKGVVVLHDGLVPMIDDQIRAFDVDAHTVSLWMLSPMFDASVSDLGTVLAAGGTVVIEPRQAWRRYEAWARLIDRHGITLVDAPPSWMNAWADRLPPPGLRTVIAGGEPTAAALLRAWSPRVRWVNVYGPTEATVCSSLERRRVVDGQDAPPTLGQPIAGLTYRVLPEDADHAGVDPVNEGELWIGGPGVAHGYWRRPALSAERFWTDAGGTRWFRTGDRVRRVGVNWHYVGRMDRQVKRNGQLLHLDEVEAVLQELPGVSRAAVWLSDLGGRDRLIAAVSGEALNDLVHLPLWKVLAAERLPGWGVPQHWWEPNAWPETPTGKTDRRALAEAWSRDRTQDPVDLEERA